MSVTGGEPQGGELGVRETDGEAMQTRDVDARKTGKCAHERSESAHVHDHTY